MKRITKQAFEFTEKVSPVRFFIFTAAIFGLLFLFITPPFEAPDEPVHFFRSYQVSTLNLSVDKVGNTYGGVLPQSLQDTITDTWDNPALAFHPAAKYPLHDTRESLSIKTTGKTHVYDFSTTAFYSPVSYIPQAVGVGLGRLLRAPPVIMMYLGRLFNLGAWIAMFALAIKLMPRKKWALVFIGLIPMALFQAASLSADVGAVGLLALTLAWILRLKDSRVLLNRRQIIGLVLLLAGLSLSKQIMFIFLPLVLLLPGRLFRDRRAAIFLKAGLIVVPLIFFGLWGLHVHGIPQSNSVGGIDPSGQEKFILHHPLNFGYALIREYFFNWGDGIIKSFFGNFGWVDTPLAEGIVMLGYIAMFVVLFGSTGAVKKWLTRSQKLLFAALLIIYILAVSAALYVYFTPVGFKVIIGLVGRYYYPAALMLVPLAYGDWLRVKPQVYRAIAVWAPVILLAASAVTIFARYYVNYV